MTAADDFRRAPLPADLDRLLHDLRGPLNAAVMHLEVLKRLSTNDASARAGLQGIQQELERLATMLPVAFAICALEGGALRPLPLRNVVESALDEEARKRVRVDGPNWPEVLGDEGLLVLAVRQLILNALEAGGADGVVQVSVEPGAADSVVLVVRDNGRGFKVKNPAAVVRLMAAAKPGHLGIGLLVAYRIARLHGGGLTFDTAGGGVVRLTLKAPPARR